MHELAATHSEMECTQLNFAVSKHHIPNHAYIGNTLLLKRTLKTIILLFIELNVTIMVQNNEHTTGFCRLSF